MIPALILALCSILPQDSHVVRTEYIELIHQYDDAGEKNFSQYVLWELDEMGVYTARFFKVYGNMDFLPLPQKRGEMWELVMFEGGEMKAIRAPSFHIEHLQYDPELLNREYFPKSLRRGIAPEPTLQ